MTILYRASDPSSVDQSKHIHHFQMLQTHFFMTIYRASDASSVDQSKHIDASHLPLGTGAKEKLQFCRFECVS